MDDDDKKERAAINQKTQIVSCFEVLFGVC